MKIQIDLDQNLNIDPDSLPSNISRLDEGYIVEGMFHDTIQLDFAVHRCNDDFRYIFYGREFLLSGEDCHYKCDFGYMYPFSMFGFLNGESGAAIIIKSPAPSYVELKKENGCCRFSIGFYPNSPCKIEFAVKNHKPSLSQSIEEYRRFYTENFGAIPCSCADVRDVYHVKRYFFHKEFCSASIVDGGEILLDKAIDNDFAEIGGVDCALLFDFAYNDQTRIRCGNTHTFAYSTAAVNRLKNQINLASKKYGIKFFAYFDPYLVENASEIGKAYPDIMMLDKEGNPHYIWNKDQSTPCLESDKWRQLSQKYIKEAIDGLGCVGVYLDEFGNSTQHRCYNPAHQHHSSYSQMNSEADYAEYLQSGIPNMLWMCEFPPCDREKLNFDIVLSDTRTLVNIYRFVFPQLKFVRIVGCDRPLGDNLWELNKSFFNGEGFWFDNDINDPIWYSARLKAAARDQYSILKEYTQFFSSAEVFPLVLQENNLLANAFRHKASVVLTFINPTDTEISACKCFDRLGFVKNLYSASDISVDKGNLWHIKIPPQEVGCVLAEILD